MHAQRWIYLTFGQWGVQAALDISNIRPLKVNCYSCYHCNYHCYC